MLILHTILTIFLVELLVINGSSPVCNARKIVVKPRGDTTQLPLLSAASDNGDYHIVYQLEMKGSTELLEEWASTREHKFRLDMIGFDGTRTSFLTDGNTGESFRYKPFSCMRTDGDKMFKELSAVAPLFIGHSWTDDKQTTQSTGATHLAYGLGPLWMRIGEMGKRVKLVNNDSSKSSKKSSKGASGNSKLPFEDQFNAYEVEVEPELTHTKQPYKLRFYFAKSGSGAEFVDTIDWILNEQDGDGDAIAAATATDKTYQVRAKVIKVDYQLDPLVLKLPIGYGCRRRSGLEPKIQVDTGEILLFQPGTIAPSQVAFEVTTSRPNDDSLQASSWTSQRHSLRVMRLSLPRANSTQPESYYVTLDQFRELPDDAAQNRGRPNLGVYDNLRPVVSQTSGSKLKRVKRVWWAPDGDQGLATVYTIDQSTGECKVDHEDVRNQVVLTSSASYATTTSSGGDEAKPIVLSIDQIELLYNEFRAYSIIEEGEQFGDSANQFRDRYYEKRFKNFELKSQDGSVVWKGPVSIVKLVSYFDNTNTNTVSKKSANSMKADSPASRSSGFKIKLIIFFYSDKQDRILFKVVIDFLDNHEVSLSYAQQQMDVSSCFKPKDKQDLVIKYPLGSISLSRELESKRETIKQQLGKRLFWDDDSILRPFHIYNIEPSFNPFYMHLQMSLVDLPLTQTFKMERGLKLAPETGSDRDKILLQLTTSSAELCGQNCDYHNCFMFSYDSSRHSCIVVLDPSKAKTMKEPTSELYTYFDRRIPQVANNDNRQSEAPLGFIYKNLKERLQLSSDVIIERLEEFVNEAQASQPGESVGDSSSAIKNLNPLIIPINMQQPSLQGEQGEAIALVPSAVEHNLETMNEYSRELEAAANDDESGSSGSNATEETKLIRVRGNKQLRLEFIIRLEDRVFDMKAFDTMLTGVTYEDCEQHCELNDCRSFSYCYSDETCQVRGDFLEKVIKSSSRSVDETKGCNIYTLNYLSKFEPYGLVPSPNPKEVQLTVRGQSELDCATACMDQTSFACQSFYVCKSNPAGPKCLLTTKTAELMQETQEAELLARSRTTGTGNSPPADQHQCSFFARSYLAQFDKYLGKRINMDGEGTGLKVISDLETCARHCLKSQCLAFDACITESILGGLSCNIIVGSIRRDQLVPERKCTTFVVADKSHFNPKRLRLVYEGADSSSTNTTNSHATTTRPAIVQPSNEETLGKPDREASVNDGQSPGGTGVPTTTNSASDKNEDGKESQQQSSGGAKLEILEEYERSLDSHHIQSAVAGHSWLAKLFTLSAGILLGFGLILGWNEAYARGWLNRRLRNHNQASRMPPARF